MSIQPEAIAGDSSIGFEHMTEVYCGMLNKGDDDSPEKCRERRRRRMQMRRLAGSAGVHMSREEEEDFRVREEGKRVRASEAMHAASLSTSSGEDAEAPVLGELAASSDSVHEPVFGTMSVSGRSREMEDAIDVQTDLCRPEICLRRPVHFFGVFDGHGGSHVAALCSMQMHVLLKEELMRVSGDLQTDRSEVQLREQWVEIMKRTFGRMDEVAMNTCACGSVGSQCGYHPLEVALSGSTAVVAALTPEHIVIANCGDSRAVLCRGGRAVPLSRDHKPDRVDELSRIESAGGRVIHVNGARVEGILAMSRAIGDQYLKPFVCSEPETTVMRRDRSDDCLILASDGLWDVLSSDLACDVACQCLQEVGPLQTEDDALYPSRSVLAAALLTRLALGRKSLDNISVIVIDLKRS